MPTVYPTLRITDYDRSRSFYVDGLGFQIDSVHRRAPHLPISMTISRDGLSLHLSQHASCQVGGLVFLCVPDVDAVYAEITGRGIQAESPPQEFENRIKDFRVVDPDGNKLGICTRLPQQRA
jgi:catechol 2,3-dioxygenase-like lactoylglutathione lyase family enzyme